MLFDLKRRREIYNKAFSTYGRTFQLTKAIEEMSELQKELAKAILSFWEIPAITSVDDLKNINAIVEELGDVEIMCEQIRYNLLGKGYQEKIDAIKEMKLIRLESRIEQEKKDLE